MGKLTWFDRRDPTCPPSFPSTDNALEEPNGLLAVGGDLSPDRLLEAYRKGIFPWYEPGQPVLWWTPDPRMVLFPEECHVSRSLRKLLRKEQFQVSADTCFTEVIEACAEPRTGANGTWITTEMQAAYQQLHLLGYAHSVEVWESSQLVGGLYGVALGTIFYGESMFSRRDNASKVALASLAKKLHNWGYQLIDCQVASEHLFSLGAREIPRTQFEDILHQGVEKRPKLPLADSIMDTAESGAHWREAWRA